MAFDQKQANPGVSILNDCGELLGESRRPSFGRSLFLEAADLPEFGAIEVRARVQFQHAPQRGEFLLCRLLVDGGGGIPLTCIWPQLGFDDLDRRLRRGRKGDECFQSVRNKWTGARIILAWKIWKKDLSEYREGRDGTEFTVEGRHRLRLTIENDLPEELSGLISIRSSQNASEPMVRIFHAGGGEIELDDFMASGKAPDEALLSDFENREKIETLLNDLYSEPKPLFYHSTHDGSLCNGFIQGENDFVLTIYGEAVTGPIARKRSRAYRVYVVPHQQRWSSGDLINPVPWSVRRVEHGFVPYLEFDLNESGFYRVQILGRDLIRPGAYDFILRRVTHGESSNSRGLRDKKYETFELHPDDITCPGVPDIVVRPPEGANITRGGPENAGLKPLNTQHIAGRRILGPPYFKISNVLNNLDDLFGTLLPTELPSGESVPSSVGLYLMRNREARDALDPWHPRPFEPRAYGTYSKIPPYVVLKSQSQTGVCGRFLLWPSAYPKSPPDDLPQGWKKSDYYAFDIVATGFREADLDRDITFDRKNCLVDGYHLPGVRLVWDPATYSRSMKVGRFEYADRGEVLVSDSNSNGTICERPSKIRGLVYYPKKKFRPSKPPPTDIWSEKSPFPLVMVVHGHASHGLKNYLGWDYLLEHLARNGYVAASIDIPRDFRITGRAHLVDQHIRFLREKVFPGHLAPDGPVALVGHSRGGAAAAAALRLNDEGKLNDGKALDIRAAIAIAPADFAVPRASGEDPEFEDVAIESPDLELPLSNPMLFVIYGSLDHITHGSRYRINPPEKRTGFALYDRVEKISKGMVFVRGAVHETFNREEGIGVLLKNDRWGRISASAHEMVIKSYVSAVLASVGMPGGKKPVFSHWSGLVRGDWIPPTLDAADDGVVALQSQFREHQCHRRVITDFQRPDASQSGVTPCDTTPLGGGVTIRTEGNLVVEFVEGDFFNLDTRTPHDTRGMIIRWDVSTGAGDGTPRVVFAFERAVPIEEIGKWRYLSIRAGRTYDPEGRWNEVDADQDFFAVFRIVRGEGNIAEDPQPEETFARISKFSRLAPPYWREEGHLPKAPDERFIKPALRTIKVPTEVLLDHVSKGPGHAKSVSALVFDLRATKSGEILIDDIELANPIPDEESPG